MQRQINKWGVRCFCYLSLLFLVCITSCSDHCSNSVQEINISSPGRNTLKVRIDLKTSEKVDAFIRYWPVADKELVRVSQTSTENTSHKLALTHLEPSKKYEFQVVVSGKDCRDETNVYSFDTPDFPVWLKDVFSVECPDTAALPDVFRKGYTLTYSKDIPGIVFFLNARGNISWYHQVNGTGFKVAHFTSKRSVIALLGTTAYPTSYGNEILELSLEGDTLFHLKKGEKELRQTIHHEVLLNDRDQIVTITSEDSVFDLSTRGGGKTDTVKGDGILVLDRQGRQVWKWSVFDVMSPMSDKDINTHKGDWMHASSLCIDQNGDYLLSFYNTGQIWKIDKRTGKLIWRFGKGGDFDYPSNAHFDQGHALHLTAEGDLMFFDNGISQRLSRTMIFRLDEKSKKASVVLNTPLPRDLFNERMGSSYKVNDTSVLSSCSKRNTIALTNAEGKVLWTLRLRFSPYRAEFIPAELVQSNFNE